MKNVSASSEDNDRLWLYALLMALQTAGAAIIIWKGLPIYRQIMAHPSLHQPKPETLVWAVASVVLIQSGYWLRLRWDLALPRRGNVLLGHTMLFLARLALIFTTSTFSVVFFTAPEGLVIPPSRVVALVVVLFSMFCYTMELERLGRALVESMSKHARERASSKPHE